VPAARPSVNRPATGERVGGALRGVSQAETWLSASARQDLDASRARSPDRQRTARTLGQRQRDHRDPASSGTARHQEHALAAVRRDQILAPPPRATNRTSAGTAEPSGDDGGGIRLGVKLEVIEMIRRAAGAHRGPSPVRKRTTSSQAPTGEVDHARGSAKVNCPTAPPLGDQVGPGPNLSLDADSSAPAGRRTARCRIRGQGRRRKPSRRGDVSGATGDAGFGGYLGSRATRAGD